MQIPKPGTQSHVLSHYLHNPLMLKLTFAFLGHYGQGTKFPKAKGFFQFANS